MSHFGDVVISKISRIICFLALGLRAIAAGLILVFGMQTMATAQTVDTPVRNDSESPSLSNEQSTSLDGRYMRWSVSLNQSSSTRFLDRDCRSTEFLHLYGCGPGEDKNPLSTAGNFGTLAGFEFGVGYKDTPNLRLEASILYQPKFSFKGNANFLNAGPVQPVSADLSAVSFMLNGYLDLGEKFTHTQGEFTPFIGGGMGISRLKIKQTWMDLPNHVTTVPGGSRTNIAWMLTAGVSMPIQEKIILDIAWRYMDYGKVETDRGDIHVIFYNKDGTIRKDLPLDVGETKADLRSHGIQISLRYPFQSG